MEPDDFNERCIDFDDFVAMEIFELESIDLGDDDEFSEFETIELGDVNDKCIENDDDELYGSNEVEVRLFDANGKVEPDDFNEKYIELDEFAAMEMVDLETTDIDDDNDDDELPVFDRNGVKDVNDKCIENGDEGACDINDDEIAFLDADGEIEPDNFTGKFTELEKLVAI